MITREEIEKLRELEQAATKGPWRRGIGNEYREVFTERGGLICDRTGSNDGDLIAAMRNALPALLDLAEAEAADASRDGGWQADAAAPESSVDYHQRRGVAWDVIDEAIQTYDEWMLDDDYEANRVLAEIMARMRERRIAYWPLPPPITEGQGS